MLAVGGKNQGFFAEGRPDEPRYPEYSIKPSKSSTLPSTFPSNRLRVLLCLDRLTGSEAPTPAFSAASAASRFPDPLETTRLLKHLEGVTTLYVESVEVPARFLPKVLTAYTGQPGGRRV